MEGGRGKLMPHWRGPFQRSSFKVKAEFSKLTARNQKYLSMHYVSRKAMPALDPASLSGMTASASHTAATWSTPSSHSVFQVHLIPDSIKKSATLSTAASL